MVYLDSSALVKLIIAEPESLGLRRYLGGEPERASCALALVEILVPSVATVPRHSPGPDDSCSG